MEMREYIETIAESCRKLIISKPATKQEEYRKIIVQKKEAFFQMEKYTDKQVFHENLSVEELEAPCMISLSRLTVLLKSSMIM